MSRITAIVMVLLMTTGVFCGKKTPAAAGAPVLPAEAFQPLTDAEIAKFKAALPGVAAALESSAYKTTLPAPDDPLPVAFTKVIDPIGAVKGVPEALAAAGTNWKDFRATHYRLSAASSAIGLEMALKQKDVWSKDTSVAARNYARRIAEMQRCLTGVPEANKQAVQKYGPELRDLGRLMRE